MNVIGTVIEYANQDINSTYQHTPSAGDMAKKSTYATTLPVSAMHSKGHESGLGRGVTIS